LTFWGVPLRANHPFDSNNLQLRVGLFAVRGTRLPSLTRTTPTLKHYQISKKNKPQFKIL
jgi:hypothetical protein